MQQAAEVVFDFFTQDPALVLLTKNQFVGKFVAYNFQLFFDWRNLFLNLSVKVLDGFHLALSILNQFVGFAVDECVKRVLLDTLQDLANAECIALACDCQIKRICDSFLLLLLFLYHILFSFYFN